MKVYDTYSKYHGRINLSNIVPKFTPLFETERKVGSSRLSKPHTRFKKLEVFDLLSGIGEERISPISDFKSILELSCRAPYCPIPFVLDTMIGVCGFNCIYCFSALTISSLMSSFFDSDKPLEPRYANPTHVRDMVDEVLTARGVEPSEKISTSKECGSTNDIRVLKKASAQRVPLRFGTRSENFLPHEKELGVAFEALKVIRDHDYPLIINSKSDLLLESPYYNIITNMGKNVALQISIIHNNDTWSKKLEPSAPPASRRWEVIKTFNEVGINAMPRMEPAGAFLNDSDEHLQTYFDKAVESGVKNFMGDVYHHTVKAEQIRRMFYRAGVDFDRMWDSTTEYQITGSYVMEKVMYYAKQHGIRAGSFNFHSLPYNDDPVCCMVGNQFGSWSKFSMVNALKNELIEKGKLGFKEFEEKYYGIALTEGYRNRIRDVWNLKLLNAWNPDFMEGAYPYSTDEDGNIIWKFDPKRIGEGYEGLIQMFGDSKRETEK